MAEERKTWMPNDVYDQASGELIVEFKAPSQCYTLLEISDKLPPGMTTRDLNNYDPTDQIITLTYQQISGCTGTGEINMSEAPGYTKTGGTVYGQVVIYCMTSGDKKHKRTRDRLTHS